MTARKDARDAENVGMTLRKDGGVCEARDADAAGDACAERLTTLRQQAAGQRKEGSTPSADTKPVSPRGDVRRVRPENVSFYDWCLLAKQTRNLFFLVFQLFIQQLRPPLKGTGMSAH